jgi:hypothetical protein
MKHLAFALLVGIGICIVADLLDRGIYVGSHTREPSRLKSCRYLQVTGVTSARALSDEQCGWFLK